MSNVLVCAPSFPDHDRQSGSQRLFDLVTMLREGDHSVTFLAQGAGGTRYERHLQRLGVLTYDRGNVHLDEVLSGGSYDVALLTFWFLAAQFMPRIRQISPATRIVVDSVDLNWLRSMRGSLQESNRISEADARLMVTELNAYAAADRVLTVSQREADLINDILVRENHAVVVPDAEQIPAAGLPLSARRGVLFVGNFAHPPNIDAVQFLCEEIAPHIDQRLLGEHPIMVVGNALNPTVRSVCDRAGAKAIGWVPSVTPYLNEARVSVVPLRIGAGTKRKLIKAVLSGLPTVATPIGVEGLALSSGQGVIVESDPLAFARSVERLLHDDVLWEQTANTGRETLSAVHARDAVSLLLHQALDLQSSSGPPHSNAAPAPSSARPVTQAVTRR